MKRIILLFMLFTTLVFGGVLEEMEKGNFDEVKRILTSTNFEDINEIDEYGDTLLHMAIKNENLEQVKYLIEKGADVNIEGHEMDPTPLMVAAAESSLEIVKYLLEKGADINRKDYMGMNVLFYAIRNDDTTNLEYLLEKGLDINSIYESEGRTLMHRIACFRDREEESMKYAKILVENGIDLNIKDNWGDTALFFAAEMENRSLIKYLVKNGADINIQNDEGNTPLIYVIDFSLNQNISKLLLLLGADASIENKNGSVAHSLSYYSYGQSKKDPRIPGFNEIIELLNASSGWYGAYEKEGKMYYKDNDELFRGTIIDRYPNGQIRYLIEYKDGIIDGKNEGYYKGAELWYSVEFKKGKKDGKAYKYYKNGQLKYEREYKDGVIVDGEYISYYENGNKEEIVNYKDGKKDGEYTSYYENGEVKKQINYRKGIEN